MANELLSKVKIGNQVYDLKDASARSELTELVKNHAAGIEALGQAAWKDVTTTVTGEGDTAAYLPTSVAVKTYVDNAVDTISIGEIVVDEAKGGEGADKNQPKTDASADTYRKIYLVPDADALAGAYIEWLTIRSGTKDAYTYAWEQIGSTKINLTDYLTKDATVAGVAFGDNKAITTADLQTALSLEDLAYAKTASGSVSTIDSITMAAVTVAGNAAVTFTETAATISDYADYTPTGVVSTLAHTGEGEGAVVTNVSFAAASTTTADATIVADTKADYTPEGTVDAPNVSVTEKSLKGDEVGIYVKSLKDGEVDAASIDTTKFSGGSFTGATAASFTQGAKASFTQGAKARLTDQSTSKFATEGITAHIASGEEISGDVDAETLIFGAASTSDAVTDRGTFTTNGDDTFEANGDDQFTANAVGTFVAASIENGFFSSNKLPVVDEKGTPEATATAPAFTGKKAEKLIPTEVKYDKVTPGAATITKQDLAFTGTKVENLIPTVVKYRKADETAAYSTAVTPTVASYAKTDKKVTVTPNAQ